MDQLHGDRATWRFDGETVLIRFHTGLRADPMLEGLGQCELPVSAIDSVEFQLGRSKRLWGRGKSRWRLRARLAERADPYLAAGAMLQEASDPFLLVGDSESELLAEYHAEQLAAAARSARENGLAPPPDLARQVVAPLPLHIQTVEGTAAFDGETVRFIWSGSQAYQRKRKQQRREFPIGKIERAEWIPADASGYGHVRIVERGRSESEVTSPAKDLACLRCYGRGERARTLLLTATIIAHLWAGGGERPQITQG